ncbi:MAG: type VI secretion system-associated FHA domain protein TagH [Thiohalomonadales bacterium]
MSLSISIVEFPEGCKITETSMKFNEQGGTIGRASDNYWTLVDPDRFLSSHHSSISYQSGSYFLIDTSTNGTFLNGSGEPIGKGNKVKLQDGDKFELSDYKFMVNLSGANNFGDSPFDNTATPFDIASSESNTDPFSQPFTVNNDINIEPMLNSLSQETDPLAVLNNRSNPFGNSSEMSDSDYFTTNETHSDQANIINQAITWPESKSTTGGMIPEDWNFDSDKNEVSTVISTNNEQQQQSDHIESRAVEVNNEIIEKLKLDNKELQLELNKAKQQLIVMHKKYKNTSSSSVDISVIAAMGMKGYDFDDDKILEINKKAGEIVRETVYRMMQVISSRNDIKNEFRLNVTTIKPVENNPLKFSVNVDDALENMFVQDGNAYKKPVEAIEDAFQGIAEHQVAVLAGIRAAFTGLITRFDPAKLEERFDRYNGGGLDLISMLRKSRNWEQFSIYYNELADDLDNSFQKLFGENFVQAYEEQLQKLVQTRDLKKRSK